MDTEGRVTFYVVSDKSVMKGTYKLQPILHIVYLETDMLTQLYRNTNREYPVPETVIGNMLRKLSVPEIHEARKVELINI